MEKWEKDLHSGRIYDPGDPEVAAEQMKSDILFFRRRI